MVRTKAIKTQSTCSTDTTTTSTPPAATASSLQTVLDTSSFHEGEVAWNQVLEDLSEISERNGKNLPYGGASLSDLSAEADEQREADEQKEAQATLAHICGKSPDNPILIEDSDNEGAHEPEVIVIKKENPGDEDGSIAEALKEIAYYERMNQHMGDEHDEHVKREAKRAVKNKQPKKAAPKKRMHPAEPDILTKVVKKSATGPKGYRLLL